MRGVTGSNNSDLSEMNRSAIVKILQQQEVCSRADIAKQTGLTQAAVTKITATLMDMGIIAEVGSMKGSGNRRSIGLRLNADKHQIIGVKFARQIFAVGVFDISGKLYTKTETEYSLDDDSKNVLSEMKKQIDKILEENENVVAIGLAVPGPYLRNEGRIAYVTQMPTWHDVNFIDEFKNEFDKPVFIEHDANAGALAEWWFGEHDKQTHTLVYLLVGEGVGAGIIQNGNLMLGTQGAAGEIGHVSVNVHGERCECGNYGCLELYCSASALIKKIHESVPEFLDSQKSENACNRIFEMTRNGDKKALEAVNDIAQYIGFGCVMLMSAYNPDVITIGDIVAQGGDLLLPIIKDVVKERAPSEIYERVQIEISTLKVDPTLYGAVATATDRVLRLPSVFAAYSTK